MVLELSRLAMPEFRTFLERFTVKSFFIQTVVMVNQL